MKQNLLQNIFLAFAFLSCNASSPSKIVIEPLTDSSGNKFHVSVNTNGRELKNFEEPLVHRIILSQVELELLKATPQNKLQLPFQGAKEFDNNGKISGLRVVQLDPLSKLPTLGLQNDDIVTAVGLKLVSETSDLIELITSLQNTKQGSITILRAGIPHKILYYLSDPR